MDSFVTKGQSQNETIKYGWDLTDRLPSGVTISSVSSTLKDPAGNEAATTTAASYSGNVASMVVTAAEVDATGQWYGYLKATLSNSEVLECEFQIYASR